MGLRVLPIMRWTFPVALLLASPASAQVLPASQRSSSTGPATRATTQPGIPIVYANEHGKRFKYPSDKELARILARANEMTSPTKKIWFVLVRAGTWFPAAEVYFVPESAKGRLREGEWRMIWRKDSEQTLGELCQKERYLQVMPPGEVAEESPRVPDTRWLPFHAPGAAVDREQVVALVDKVQQVRPVAREVWIDRDEPITLIEIEDGQFRVEVTWPDKGYEHYFLLKAVGKGFEVVEENTVWH